MVPMGAVCVRNLREDVTVDDIEMLFDRYGVQAAPMSLAQPQGRCIIRYADEKDAAYVAKVLDGYVFAGRPLHVRLLPAMAHERSVVVAHGTLQCVAQSSEATERELGPRQLARAPGATIRVQHLDPHSLARCQLISRGVVGSNSSSTDWRDGSGSITYLLDCAPAQCELLVSALRAQSIHAEVMPASPPARAQSSGSLPAHRGSRSRSPRRRRSPGRSPPYHRHPLVDDAPSLQTPSLQTLLVPQPPFDWAWAPRQKPVRPWAPPPPGPGQGTGGWR